MQLAFGDFINGAKYADKTMLDRACEWLKLRISIDVPVETNEKGEPLADSLFDKQIKRAKLAEEFIADFRQAMKGEQSYIYNILFYQKNTLELRKELEELGYTNGAIEEVCLKYVMK